MITSVVSSPRKQSVTLAVRGIMIADTAMYFRWQETTWQKAEHVGRWGMIPVDLICICIWKQCSSFMVRGLFFPEWGGLEESCPTLLLGNIFPLLHF